MAVTWEDVRADFDFADAPGALLDLLVLDTSVEDFQKLMDLIRAHPEWQHRYLEDGAVVPLPASAAETFQHAEQVSAHLEINPAEIYIRGYFNFGPDRIEFDLSPDDINSADRFAVLTELMTAFGRATGKLVIAAPEGLTDTPLVRYDPIRDGLFAS